MTLESSSCHRSSGTALLDVSKGNVEIYVSFPSVWGRFYHRKDSQHSSTAVQRMCR